MEDLYLKTRNAALQAQNILVISHRKPDADTLGAGLALRFWLKTLQKQVTNASIDKPASVFVFLPAIGEFVTEFKLEDFDLIFIVDAGASYMTNFETKYPDLLSKKIPIINIDHHASNDMFGDINIVDSKAPSTTVMIYRMFQDLGVVIDEDISTCLMAGIYGDTGAFMHSNTSSEVLRIASDLMTKGAKIMDITKNLFKSRSISTLRLWGRVLENAYLDEQQVVMSVVKEEDYKQAGSSPDQLTGVVDYLNMIPGSKFAVLLNEDRHGNVKGSFRTRSQDLDLSKIAGKFGGGGHPKASGFSIPGKLQEELKYSIIENDSSKRTLEF
ncbi:MAG: bifunctional oligoribonuclease/PAP phosphatase NrnA [Patescibacteria group bacterium]